jgi:hypothetical protein
VAVHSSERLTPPLRLRIVTTQQTAVSRFIALSCLLYAISAPELTPIYGLIISPQCSVIFFRTFSLFSCSTNSE